MTKLQCLEVDIEYPLSSLDWSHFSEVIGQVKGMGWIQLLPAKYKSSHPLQFNMMHIIPSSKIPLERVPIDRLIATKLTFLKKEEKISKDMSTIDANFNNVPVHKSEALARESGLILLDEFEFPHAIF